jgi:hypothetical protein
VISFERAARAREQRQAGDCVGEVIQAELVTARTSDERQLAISGPTATLVIPRRIRDRSPHVLVGDKRRTAVLHGSIRR